MGEGECFALRSCWRQDGDSLGFEMEVLGMSLNGVVDVFIATVWDQGKEPPEARSAKLIRWQ